MQQEQIFKARPIVPLDATKHFNTITIGEYRCPYLNHTDMGGNVVNKQYCDTPGKGRGCSMKENCPAYQTGGERE